MAIKSTTVTAEIDISDMERYYYRTHKVTLQQLASETDERMMVRLLAFAFQADDALRFCEDPDEPALWVRDGSASPDLWIEVGEPEEKRLLKACAKAKKVIVYTYASSAPGWWNQLGPKLEKDNLTIYHIQGVPTSNLSKMAGREIKMHCMIQDGQIWVTVGEETLQLNLDTLKP